MADQSNLSHRAGTVAAIYQTIATVVIILGLLAVVAGFIQAIANSDEIFVGIMAGLLIALVIGVYVVVAWAGVQMFALVAGYISVRTGGSDRN